jgi:hypothetical protein
MLVADAAPAARRTSRDTATQRERKCCCWQPCSNDVSVLNREQYVPDALGTIVRLGALEWSLAAKHRMGTTQPSCSLVFGFKRFLSQAVEFDSKSTKRYPGRCLGHAEVRDGRALTDIRRPCPQDIATGTLRLEPFASEASASDERLTSAEDLKLPCSCTCGQLPLPGRWTANSDLKWADRCDERHETGFTPLRRARICSSRAR